MISICSSISWAPYWARVFVCRAILAQNNNLFIVTHFNSILNMKYKNILLLGTLAYTTPNILQIYPKYTPKIASNIQYYKSALVHHKCARP